MPDATAAHRKRRQMVACSLLTGGLTLGLLTGCGGGSHAMPDLVGMRLDEALQSLEAAGFEDVDANPTFGGLFVISDDRWAVISQTPAAGAAIDLDESVDLGAGPLDDSRTPDALPAEAPMRSTIEAALAAEQAVADAERAAASAADAAEAAEEAAAEPVTAADVGLPEVYATDHGKDSGDRPRPRVLRRDLAEYLAAVRTADPATADQIAPALRVVPAAWCSLWLPHHTGTELADWLTQAEASAALMADAFNVDYTSVTTPAIAAVMTVAQEEAGRRFCPEQAAQPGQRVDVAPRGAGVFPGEGETHVRMTTTVLDWWYFNQTAYGNEATMPADLLRLAYLDMLGQPAQHRWKWPVLMDCDFYAHVLSGELRDSTVEDMLWDNKVIIAHDPAEMEQTVLREAGYHFDALVGSAIKGC